MFHHHYDAVQIRINNCLLTIYLRKKLHVSSFMFICRYEDGQVGDANINTQEPKVQKEIMRVIGTQIYSS